MMGGLVKCFTTTSRYLMQAYGCPKFTNHILSKLIVRGYILHSVGRCSIKVLVSHCQWKNRRFIVFRHWVYPRSICETNRYGLLPPMRTIREKQAQLDALNISVNETFNASPPPLQVPLHLTATLSYQEQSTCYQGPTGPTV